MVKEYLLEAKVESTDYRAVGIIDTQVQQDSLASTKKDYSNITKETLLILAASMPQTARFIASGYIFKLMGPDAIAASEIIKVVSTSLVMTSFSPIMYTAPLMSKTYGDICKLSEELSLFDQNLSEQIIELEHKKAELKKIFWTANLYAISISSLILMPVFISSIYVLPYLINNNIADSASSYLVYGSLYLIPFMLSAIATNLMMAIRKQELNLVFSFLENSLTLGLGAVLALGLSSNLSGGLLKIEPMGLPGMAIAHAIVPSTSLIIKYLYLRFSKSELALFSTDFYKYIDKKFIKDLLKNGIFMSMQDASERMSLFFMAFVFASISVNLAIASSAATHMLHIFLPILNSVKRAASNILVFYLGKPSTQEQAQKSKIYAEKMQLLSALVVGGLCAGLCFAFSDNIIKLFGSDLTAASTRTASITITPDYMSSHTSAYVFDQISDSELDYNSVTTTLTSTDLISQSESTNQYSQYILAKNLLYIAAGSIVFDALARVNLGILLAKYMQTKTEDMSFVKNIVIPSVTSFAILCIIPVLYFTYNKIFVVNNTGENTQGMSCMALRTGGMFLLSFILFLYQSEKVRNISTACCRKVYRAITCSKTQEDAEQDDSYSAIQSSV